MAPTIAPGTFAPLRSCGTCSLSTQQRCPEVASTARDDETFASYSRSPSRRRLS